MDETSLLQYFLFLSAVALLVKPLGQYIADTLQRTPSKADIVFEPLEALTYRLAGIDARQGMNWKEYALSFIWLTMGGALFLYAVMRLQVFLPWFYPQYMTTPISPDLAMNTAISFATTTTWQAYAGETTMSYVSQMLALVCGNFLGAAASIAIGGAFIRGFSNSCNEDLGNFYVDFFRALFRILLPASMIGSLFLVAQGVPMNFNQYTSVTSLEGNHQIIAQGPVAALEFIKNLGTNGGGFFNVNGAHPYANPTALTNFIGMLAIVVLPAAFTYTFGTMTDRKRDGWTLFVTMVVLFTIGLFWCQREELLGNPNINNVVQLSSSENMEGKETRFGIAQSVLAAETTSVGSTGSYNSMHDSFTPIGGMVPLVNMLVGQFIFGGIGTGIYSMIVWALLTMFVVGLMVGRTPEYICHKIGPLEIKLVTLYTLATPMIVLVLTAIALVTRDGLAGLTTNTGPHGLTEIIYAYASSNANNGQNFAGLSANTPFYNITTAMAMMVGRFMLAVPVLALAGQFALQPTRRRSIGMMPTDTPLFVVVLISTIVIMGGLSYCPALILGPIVENFVMHNGLLF